MENIYDFRTLRRMAEEQLVELNQWYAGLQWDHGRCNVLCVGFATSAGDGTGEYLSTIHVERPSGVCTRTPCTLIPSLVNTREAEQIKKTMRFRFGDKPMEPVWNLVRVDRWYARRSAMLKEYIAACDKAIAGGRTLL